MARFEKGKSGNPAGKPKGTKNRIPADLQAKVMESLEDQKKGIQEEAEKDPKWFYETFVKALLPKNIPPVSGERRHAGRSDGKAPGCPWV